MSHTSRMRVTLSPLTLLLAMLSGCGESTPPPDRPAPAAPADAIGDIRVVSVYERVLERRPVSEVAALLSGVRTDFVFRGFYKSDADWGFAREAGLYTRLAAAIAQLKAVRPTLVVQGAITAHYLDPRDSWADGTPLSEEDVANMVLVDGGGDPVTEDHPELPGGYAYVTDIARPAYRDFLVGWVAKQIDAGVESMFFDQLFAPVAFKSGSPEEARALLQTYEDLYWKDLVDRVKAYAASRGGEVLVTANQTYASAISFHPWTYTDIATVQVRTPDLSERRITEDWELLKQRVRESHGGMLVPIVTFIDWGNDPNAALGVFASQSPEDQGALLRMLDGSTLSAGLLFAYPVHGGQPGFQRFGVGTYDSVRYGTFDTIVELSGVRATAGGS